MRIFAHRILPVILLSAFCISGAAQTVTLYPPQDPVTKTYSEGKACFSFKSGAMKEITKKDWDLGYGFLAINHQDWFRVNISNGNRNVIEDLGERKWEDHFTVPVLEPLPAAAAGAHREITVDASGGPPSRQGGYLEQQEKRDLDRDLERQESNARESRENPARQYEPSLGRPAAVQSPARGEVRTNPANISAKVVMGHMYVVHVKDDTKDFYVLFRVEDFEQNKHCTISWRLANSSKPAKEQ